MKSGITVLIFSLLFGNLEAQNRDEQAYLKYEADKYYVEEQYNLATQYYRQLANLSDQDAEVNYQLAESYRKTFNYTEAETYFLKAYYQQPDQFPLSLYYYSLMLKLNGSFDESIANFTLFIAATENKKEFKEIHEQAIVDRAGSEMAKNSLHKANPSVHLESESINTPFNDYAPTLLDSSTLVITSGRIENKAIDERYGEAFTDNFYFIKHDNVWQEKTKQVFAITNTRYNDGSGCFNHQGNKYYFTVCGKDSPQCRIFLSVLKDNKWTEPVALNDNINYKTFETKHPTVSKGGDTLMFSSNRTGGFGNFDIWMSINAGHENWGPAMNLGGTINTKLNELSPAFTGFSHVFFLSSDGHQNYGGLDLYMAKRFSNGVVALYNLDYPFNSTRDDCFITFAERKIYFSSNREGGIGGFDIYSAGIPSVISFISKLSLKNRVSRGDVNLNARTAKINSLDLLSTRNEDRIEYDNLTYEKKQIVNKIVANQIKNIPTKIEQFHGLGIQEYEALIRIAVNQYKIHEVVKLFEKTLLTKVVAPTDSSREVSVTGILRDSLSGKLMPLRKILSIDEMGVLKVTQTNEEGKFRFTHIPPGSIFSLRLENVAADIKEEAKIENLQIIGSENHTTVDFGNIYFDFDHYNLRPEAKLALNDLADFLKKSKDVQVEIFAFADDRGEIVYNLALTQKRGQAVLDYLTTLGVDQTAIAIIAKGKQQNRTTQLEIQRQYNRRAEFYLNGETIKSTQTVKTYILKKQTDWVSLSAATGVNVEELKGLNGATKDDLVIYEPVRIPAGARAIPETLFFQIR